MAADRHLFRIGRDPGQRLHARGNAHVGLLKRRHQVLQERHRPKPTVSGRQSNHLPQVGFASQVDDVFQ